MLAVVGPDRWLFPVGVAAGLAVALLEGFGLALLIPLIGAMAGTGTTGPGQPGALSPASFAWLFSPSPGVLVALLCLSLLLRVCMSYATAAVFALIGQRVAHRLRQACFRQLLRVHLDFLERTTWGKLINTIATETWRVADAIGVVANLAKALCMVLVFSGLLVALSWRLTGIVLVAAIVIGAVVMVLTRRIGMFSHHVVEANSRFGEQMYDAIGGLKVIRTFGTEEREIARFEGSSREVASKLLSLGLLSALTGPVFELLSSAVLVVLLLLLMSQPGSSMAGIAVFMLLVLRLQPYLRQTLSDLVGLRAALPSLRDVDALVRTDDKPYTRSGTLPFAGLKNAIVFDHVAITYAEPGSSPVLVDASFTIPAGRTTALVGPSGAGKTTIINLLARLYDPTAGRITVDGVPLEELSLEDWRSRIAVVSQDAHLFDCSIFDNIAYARPSASRDEVIDAARQAEALAFIERLPNGFDSRIGERGARISGGQRQRIALARAILRDADIVILDEATNALDAAAENIVVQAVDRYAANRTLLVVTHRFSSIAGATHAVVIEDGRTVQEGPPAELMKIPGLFADYRRLQRQGLAFDAVEADQH